MQDSGLSMTKHAGIRARQRGVPRLIMEWLDNYGARIGDGHGGEVLYFDRASRKSLEKAVGVPVVDRLRPLLDAYMVIGEDGTVVTTGWRYKRLPNQ